MEKRFFIAFIITLAFFIVYSHIVSKYFPQNPRLQDVTKKSIQERQLDPSQGELMQETLKELKETDEKLSQEKIGKFFITFSTRGGYIKEISLGSEEDSLPFKNIGFSSADAAKEFVPAIHKDRLTFQGPSGEKKEFIFNGYTLEIKLGAPPSAPLTLFSNEFFSKSWDFNQRYHEFFYSLHNSLKRSAPRKTKTQLYKGIEFAGARDRYYCLSLLKGDYDLKWLKEKDKGYLYLLSVNSSVSFYIGPQTEKLMQPFGLEGVIYYGFFHLIGVGMVKLLYFLFLITKNWGVSIVFFSGVIYLILFPFTAKSTKAMKRMQEFQPEIESLKEKHKDNPQKLQKETIELYRKHKINPLGGCLPLFLQFPVFIALYQVLFRLVDLKGAHFLWIKDLSSPDRFLSLPFTLPILKTNYLNLLPVCVAVLGIIQQRILGAQSSPSTQASQQKTMGLVMAVFIGFIFYKFPSALVLYWFVQNILTITYQIRIRTIPSPA